MAFSCIGKPVVLSKEVESVLVGAAILGACASGDFTSIQVCSSCSVFSSSVLMHFTLWHLAPCTDFNSSGKVCTFCTAGQEPALLSLHPLFNSICYLGLLKIHLSSDCRGMQVEAALYDIRPCNFTDRKKFWSCKKVMLSSWLYLSYFPSFVLGNVEHKKQHSSKKWHTYTSCLAHSECRGNNEDGTSCLFMLFQSINSCKSSSKGFMVGGSAKAWLSCISVNSSSVQKPDEGSECPTSYLFSQLAIPLVEDMSSSHAAQGQWKEVQCIQLDKVFCQDGP